MLSAWLYELRVSSKNVFCQKLMFYNETEVSPHFVLDHIKSLYSLSSLSKTMILLFVQTGRWRITGTIRGVMSAELDLSPPEVPEPTFLESLLRYGLFLGAIFQLICILAVIFPTSKGNEHVGVHRRPGIGFWLSFTVAISTQSQLDQRETFGKFSCTRGQSSWGGALQNKLDIACYEYHGCGFFVNFFCCWRAMKNKTQKRILQKKKKLIV